MTKLFAWMVLLLTSPIWVPMALMSTFFDGIEKLWTGSLWLFDASFVTVLWSMDTVRGTTKLPLGEYTKEHV